MTWCVAVVVLPSSWSALSLILVVRPLRWVRLGGWGRRLRQTCKLLIVLASVVFLLLLVGISGRVTSDDLGGQKRVDVVKKGDYFGEKARGLHSEHIPCRLN